MSGSGGSFPSGGGAAEDSRFARWDLADAWLRRATEVIGRSAEALNSLNVFPIPDADTGANLTLTLRGVADAVERVSPASLDAVVQAAILSAHGNSGAIVAEMLTSVCRTLQSDPALGTSGPGQAAALLLRTVAAEATQAVARPVTGTILTVAEKAAAAAATAAARTPDDALLVVSAARDGARQALAATPEQLAVLAAAGVVDAGGQAYVLLLDVLVEVLGGPPAVPLRRPPGPRTGSAAPAEEGQAQEYEVMYALRGARRPDLDRLRDRLSEIGSSVLVVGDEAIASVHVHLAAAGAAVEAALGLGTLSSVRITALPAEPGSRTRTVLCLVAGPGLAEAVEAQGAVALPPSTLTGRIEQLSAAIRSGCDDLIILPNDMESLEAATHLARTLRTAMRRIAVLPTVAQVQGLAALAVHEPSADFDAAVTAMSRAAGHARSGAVTVAENAAMTVVGRCRPGDVLGVVEGDVVLIGQSPTTVGEEVVARLLAGGGELLTLVTGADAAPEAARRIADRAQGWVKGLEVEILHGGQPRYPLLIGVE